MVTQNELLRLISNNKQKGFNILYQEYHTYFKRYIRKFIADSVIIEDIVQDGFVAIWQNIHTYNPNNAPLIAWMTTIMKYRAFNYIKREKKRFEKETNSSLYITKTDTTLEKQIEGIGIKEHLNVIEKKYQTLLRLKYYQGATTEEISQEMKISTSQVYVWQKQGINQLKSAIAGKRFVSQHEIYVSWEIPEDYSADLNWPKKCMFLLKLYGSMDKQELLKNIRWLEPMSIEKATYGVRQGLETLKKGGRLKDVSSGTKEFRKISLII